MTSHHGHVFPTQVVRELQYPETLGKMEVRVGIHCGPLAAGVMVSRGACARLLSSLFLYC